MGSLGVTVTCNKLKCVRVPTFDDDTRKYLQTLELQGNVIEHLPKMEYRRMDTLDLSWNDLWRIENGTFVDCKIIDDVDFSNNDIGDVHPNAFDGDAIITKINFASNKLKDVPRLELYSLRQLNLSNNLIKELEDNTFSGGMRSLTSLDLSRNRIEVLKSEAFHGLHQLSELHLQFNLLSKLTDNVFHTHVYNLQYLDLSFNQIEMLSHNAFTDLENLEFLDLSHNSLQDVADVHFLGLYQLTKLFLQYNDIRNLSKGLVSECDDLHTLDVSSNPVQTVHPYLFVHKLNRPIPLKILRMNKLEGVTEISNGTFQGLPDLETVEISNNINLQTIQPEAFDRESRNIKVLDLRRNKLGTVSEHLVNWISLEELDLSGNPWDCNCELLWMKGPSFPEKYQDEVTCVYPTFLAGRTISTVDESKFSCEFFYEHRREGAILLVLFLTSVFMIIGGFVLHKHRYKVFPCFYNTPMYTSFYNPLYTDEKDAVKHERMKDEPTSV